MRSAEPRRSDSLRHQVPSCAQPPPLTRAAGSSPWRRRPRTAEGRGQRQQIGELLGRRAQVSAQSHRTRDGEQGSRPGPPTLSTSPRPTGAGLQFPAVSVGPLPPRARHHGAPAQRLASAAARRPSAPRGAQPSLCEGESPAGCAPQSPSLHPRRPVRPLCPAPGAVKQPGPRGCRGWQARCTLPPGLPLVVPVGCDRTSITEPPLLWAECGRVRKGLKLSAHHGGVRVPRSR